MSKRLNITMMKIIIGLLLVCVVCVSGVPVISENYQVNEQDFLVIYQGEYTVDTNLNFGCSEDATCKVQTEAQSGMNYVDYAHNRTRFEAQGQAIISIYSTDSTDGGEYLVDSNNTCQSYCPIQAGEVLPPTFAVPQDAQDQGPVTINDVTYEQWYWAVKIDHIVPLQENTLLVDSSGNPYSLYQHLDPFNMELGRMYSSYVNFKAGIPDASLFQVNGIADCPLDSSCDDSQNGFTVSHIRNRRDSAKIRLHKATSGAHQAPSTHQEL